MTNRILDKGHIEHIIEEYIKNHLTIEIETESIDENCPSYEATRINVEIQLDGNRVSRTSFTIPR